MFFWYLAVNWEKWALMQIGTANIDFDSHQITGPAGDYSVEPKVMEVLSVLAENAGQVVTRESLIDQVWGVGYGGDERLSRAISILRKSFGDTRGKHNYIQTIPKTGYKLTVEIEKTPQNNRVETGEMHATTTVHAPETLPKTEQKSWSRLIPLLSAVFLAVAAFINFSKDSFLSSPKPPLVMVMDSAHPARIYDEQVKSNGGTNADILSDILADLPIRTQKELISPSWDRYEAIIQFDPDLIVIHYSGFKQEDASGDRPQLRLLAEYFLKTDTEFLVYSRASQAWLEGKMDIVLKELYTENPAMRDRIKIFPLLEYGEPNWMDQASAQGVKLKIKDILDIE